MNRLRRLKRRSERMRAWMKNREARGLLPWEHRRYMRLVHRAARLEDAIAKAEKGGV